MSAVLSKLYNMSLQRVKLNVLGITFSQVQAGAYALILGEENGARRIPVIIGTPEAQSIAIFLEGLHPPRPLTHDIFISFMQKFEIEMEEIFIYKFDEGIFFSEIHFKGSKEVKLDARTSDAIALAIRCNAPIYTTEDIMKEAGIMLEDSEYEIQEDDIPPFEQKDPTLLENKTLQELEVYLNDAIAAEDYEMAAKIKTEISKRNNNT